MRIRYRLQKSRPPAGLHSRSLNTLSSSINHAHHACACGIAEHGSVARDERQVAVTRRGGAGASCGACDAHDGRLRASAPQAETRNRQSRSCTRAPGNLRRPATYLTYANPPQTIGGPSVKLIIPQVSPRSFRPWFIVCTAPG
jgi:hypothetical protein